MTTYSLVAHIADEISSSCLKGYVDAMIQKVLWILIAK